MHVENIRSAEVEKHGVITHKMMADDTVNRWVAVRGGVAWATPSAPAYYCIVGQEYIPGTIYQGQPRKEGKLVLLAEHRSISLVDQTQFFRRLTDDAARAWCSSWFGFGCEGLEQDPDAEAFRMATRRAANPGINLQPAPWAEKFSTGFSLIADYRSADRLKIPAESALYRELTTIGEPELSNNPAERFNAVNALRYVLAAFKKMPPGGRFSPPVRRGRARRP